MRVRPYTEEELAARRKRNREWHAEKMRLDPERVRARQRALRAKNPQVRTEQTKRWRAANPDKSRQSAKNWRANNREKSREVSRRTANRWRVNNRGRKNAAEALRDATKLQATPRWADREAMEAIYIKARALTVETGTPYQVDHIVPLVHPFVCGLHVPANLQILTASENASKGNRWFPGDGNERS